jgi:hypothetical protein
MRTILHGFIGGIVMWAVIYALANYFGLPQQYHDLLINTLGIPGKVIVYLITLLNEKAGLAIVGPSWMFVQSISWGVLGGLVSLAIRIINF